MKRTLLFLVYSYFFVGCFGISANEEISYLVDSSRNINGLSATYSFPVLMYVVNRVCSPALRDYFKGEAPSPTSIVSGPQDDIITLPLKKQASGGKVIQERQQLLKKDVFAEIIAKYRKFQENHVVKVPAVKRQVSFSGDTKGGDGPCEGWQYRACLTPDLGPTPDPTKDNLRISVDIEEPKGLRRTGSGLVDCFVKSPSPPPTPADNGVRSRTCSEDSSNGFYLGSIHSSPASPREVVYKRYQEDQEGGSFKKDSSFYGSHAELIEIAKQVDAQQRLTENRTDLQRQLIVELAKKQVADKKLCGTPKISPIVSPDVKQSYCITPPVSPQKSVSPDTKQ